MLATLLTALVLAAPPTQDITIDHLLVLPPQGGAGRAPFRADPLLQQLSFPNWHTPAQGDKVGEREWKALDLPADSKDHVFEHQSLAGGYALATFTAEADGVMILDAAGHTMVYVNPSPTTFELHTGDPYENGSVRIPIHVNKGTNTLLFAAGRGRLRAKLSTPPAPVFISPADPTMPDLVEEVATTTLKPLDLLGAVVVVNASDQWQRGLTILAFCPGAPEPTRTPLPPIPPLSIRKVPVNLIAHQQLTAGETQFDLALMSDHPTKVPFKVRIRKPDQTRKITFRSDIDGSIQYFGFNPAAFPDPNDPNPARPGLILSLHGASVEAAHQAECYSLKPWAALAAPTNRREYGFDWEDWGRLDALEVLALAKTLTHADPQRIYLTGHSMGGHGAWLIGSTYPDLFAAIAPSAGWSTFWSYGGAQHFDKPPHPTPIEKMFQKAMNPGDTTALAPTNLSSTGVYILHGDKDDNVPVGQARAMHELLKDHKDLQYHEQPGAGHWWGNECMDWPPLMDFLKSHTIPKPADITHIAFTTANPAVSSRCHWASIVQQHTSGAFSSIDLTFDPKTGIVRGTTTNVATLALDLSALHTLTIELDGQRLERIALPNAGPLYLRCDPAVRRLGPNDGDGTVGKWSATPLPADTEKSPARSGPFKHAFNHHPLLIYGTKGNPAENAWMLAKARFDAESIWYRGNSALDIIPDTDFAPNDPAKSYPDRSLILYGNANINAAWPALLKDSPLEAHEGGIFLGEHEFKDDWYAALFVRPRPPTSPDMSDVGSRMSEPDKTSPAAAAPTSDIPHPTSRALVAAVAFTGLRGARALERLPYFSSGVAYPDWTILSARTLTEGMQGVEAAGYFGNDWGLDEGQSAWLTP